MDARASSFVLMCLLALAVCPVSAQEEEREDETSTASGKTVESELDQSIEVDSESLRPFRVLFPSSVELLGLASIKGFHIPAGRETGPFLGPPLEFWSNGIGTSVWRDPVTGRAIP